MGHLHDGNNHRGLQRKYLHGCGGAILQWMWLRCCHQYLLLLLWRSGGRLKEAEVLSVRADILHFGRNDHYLFLLSYRFLEDQLDLPRGSASHHRITASHLLH